MSNDSKLSTFTELALSTMVNMLRAGPTPSHVAFIMDGNRRYAKRHHTNIDGHSAGFNILSSLLNFCYRLGVKEVTVFAFSIENFKRSPAEVENLMTIAHSRLKQICESGDLVEQYGVRVNIIGDVSLLPASLLDLVKKIREQTKDNKKAILNICMPYTARDDLAHAVREITRDYQSDLLQMDDIGIRAITDHLYTSASLPLDILIRTSDTTRLSDFLLWEIDERRGNKMCAQTYIEFTKKLWPEYTVWEFFKLLVRWSAMQMMAKSSK